MRILVVEDKKSLAGHLGQALEREGHTVTLAYDGDEALRLGRSDLFDLMILDVMLPRKDGLTVIRKLREDRLTTQTLILSARDSMQDIVMGLDAGADDYLTKPFPLDVLMAKVRASERRLPTVAPQTIELGDLVLRPHLYELQRGNRIISLTRIECLLVETLMRRTRAVVPHQVLIEAGWGDDSEVSYDSLYVFIRTLRSKLTQPGEPEILYTIRGVGYTLRPESS